MTSEEAFEPSDSYEYLHVRYQLWAHARVLEWFDHTVPEGYDEICAEPYFSTEGVLQHIFPAIEEVLREKRSKKIEPGEALGKIQALMIATAHLAKHASENRVDLP